MLVLGRTKHQSVVIGDEITLTVEEICDSAKGERIAGASVRLGFETPREIPIYRSELRAERRDRRLGEAPQRRSPPRSEDRVVIPDAQVRLRIQVPPKVPVYLNGKPTRAMDSEEGTPPEARAMRSVHRVICRLDDRIAICNNIMISALRFQRAVAGEPVA